MLKKSPSPVEMKNLIHAVNSGDFASAEALASALSKTYPKATLVWKILGVAIAEQDRMAEAIAPMQKVVQLEPKDAEAHRNLATALKELGQIERAETLFRKAIALNAQDPLSHYYLAKILNETSRFIDAEKLCRKAITLQYSMAEAHDQLGIALLGQKNNLAAEGAFNTAILLNPAFADAHNNLGIALNEQHKLAAAEASFRQALALNPEFANAYNNLGNTFYAQKKLQDAETFLLRAIELKPVFPEAFNTLGNIYKDLNQLDQSINYFRKAIAAEPAMTVARSNLLLTAGYNAKLSQAELFAEAKSFGDYAAAQVKQPYTQWRCRFPVDTAKEKIRVGFVSGDFRKHAVAFFIEGLLRTMDKNKFELIAYPTQANEDDITALLKPNFNQWRPIYSLNNKDAAELIHQDAPHILFDLSGHTASNRLPMFAYKPAPIQVTWLGYPATTGISAMDYIIGDPYLTPLGDEQFFVEKIWRLPEIAWCFNPLLENIATAELPALKNNFITFGCFNNLAKMNDTVVEVWSKILHAVPRAKLYLQANQLNEARVMQATYERFAAWGIDAERLILEQGGTRENYFRSFNKMDIALDPFPCPGGTTSTDTVWMSVPVLTLKGRDFWSRIGETIAQNIGLSDWIAKDIEDYIHKAIAYSADLTALAALRAKLRQDVMASPLYNQARYVQHFEAALTGMVKSYERP